MKNQQQMMKQLQQVQARMAKMQEELNDVTVTGTAGGGVVSHPWLLLFSVVVMPVPAGAVSAGPGVRRDVMCWRAGWPGRP